MKLKSLFLTSMVALALGACSNATEEATTSTDANSANLSFSITMPATSSSSRANSNNEDFGTSEEYNLTNIALKLTYSDGKTVTKTFANADFTSTVPAYNTDANQKVVYTLSAAAKAKAQIPTGSITSASAVVNGTFDNDVVTGDYGQDLLGLSNGIAKSKEFLMTGIETPAQAYDVSAGKTADISIEVDRVAAKIQEVTTQTEFTNVTSNNVTVTLTNYSLLNLNTKSNVFSAATFANSELTKANVGTSNFAQLYLNENKNTNYVYSNYKSLGISDANKTYYCMENANSVFPTKVVYVANIKVADVDAGTDLYVKNGIVYTLAQLKTVMSDLISFYNLNEGSSYEDWLTEVGVTKYTKGVCYYVADITTNNVAKIVRNNWYKLNVTGISGLGTPVIDPIVTPESSYLTLSVTINPWKVNTNNFNLGGE